MVIMSNKKYEKLIKRIEMLEEKVSILNDELFSTTDVKQSVVFKMIKNHQDILDKNQPVVDRARLAMGIEELKDSKEQQDIIDEWLYGENKKGSSGS